MTKREVIFLVTKSAIFNFLIQDTFVTSKFDQFLSLVLYEQEDISRG